MKAPDTDVSEVIRLHIEYYKSQYRKSLHSNNTDSQSERIIAKIEALADFGMQYQLKCAGY